jgi:hypothetical protein
LPQLQCNHSDTHQKATTPKTTKFQQQKNEKFLS